MKLEHTRGVWESFGRMVSIPHIGKNLKKQKGRFICDCMSPDDGTDDPEDNANARLIATAPDMLECLINLVRETRMSGLEYKETFREEIDIIEKATGQKIEDIIS